MKMHGGLSMPAYVLGRRDTVAAMLSPGIVARISQVTKMLQNTNKKKNTKKIPLHGRLNVLE
jgi:hypothetical protein